MTVSGVLLQSADNDLHIDFDVGNRITHLGFFAIKFKIWLFYYMFETHIHHV
jgi:hypothetical protein